MGCPRPHIEQRLGLQPVSLGAADFELSSTVARFLA